MEGTHFITLLLYETLDSSSTQLWVDRHLVIELHLWFSAVNQKNLASRALGRMCSTEAACKKMACVFLSQTRLVHFICIACCLRLNSWQKTEFRGPVCRIDDKKIRCFFGIVAHCRAYFFINWISWSYFDTVTTKSDANKLKKLFRIVYVQKIDKKEWLNNFHTFVTLDNDWKITVCKFVYLIK